MLKINRSKTAGVRPLFAALITSLALVTSAQGQSTPAPPQPQQSAGDDKAEQVLRRAVEALGGGAFLGVRTVVGRGLFTLYREGQPGLPSSFVDYIVYPDKERTEFRGGGMKVTQVNTGNTGWVYDADARTLKDVTPAQAEEFKRAMRTGYEQLLRGAWRKEGATLAYAGRREAGIGRRNEAVRLTYPDGFSVEFEFGARDGLPAKILYKKRNAENEEIAEEDRLAQFVGVGGGALAPFIVDHYTAGAQTSRVNYQSIEFNVPVPDSFFARPANAKSVK